MLQHVGHASFSVVTLPWLAKFHADLQSHADKQACLDELGKSVLRALSTGNDMMDGSHIVLFPLSTENQVVFQDSGSPQHSMGSSLIPNYIALESSIFFGTQILPSLRKDSDIKVSFD